MEDLNIIYIKSLIVFIIFYYAVYVIVYTEHWTLYKYFNCTKFQ